MNQGTDAVDCFLPDSLYMTQLLDISKGTSCLPVLDNPQGQNRPDSRQPFKVALRREIQIDCSGH
jgi:hypothetical protein